MRCSYLIQIRPSTPSSVISRPTCFSSSLRCCWQVGSAPFVRRRCDCLATSAPFTNIQTYLLTYLHLGVKRIDGMQCKSRQPAVLRTSPALCSFYDQPCYIYVRVNAKSYSSTPYFNCSSYCCRCFVVSRSNYLNIPTCLSKIWCELCLYMVLQKKRTNMTQFNAIGVHFYRANHAEHDSVSPTPSVCLSVCP